MVGLEILGVSLVAFITYLYLPTAVFRFGAERFVDMRPRPDSSELAEFIDSTLPSLLFHGITWLVLRLVVRLLALLALAVSWVHNTNGVAVVMRRRPLVPVVDWRLLGNLLGGGENDYLRLVLRDRAIASLVYIAAVIAVSLCMGLMFGISYVEAKRQRSARDRFPPAPVDWVGIPLFIIRIFIWPFTELAYAVNYWVTTFLFLENVEPWMQWRIRQPHVFVRTKNDRLYFGQFADYAKNRSGQVDSMTIKLPWRYCYDEREKTIQEGRVPLSDFGGRLEITREEVAEIHETTPDHLDDLRDRYERARLLHLASTLLERFAGETLTLDDVWKRRGGGDHFTPGDVAMAVTRLVEERVVNGSGPDSYTFPRARRERA